MASSVHTKRTVKRAERLLIGLGVWLLAGPAGQALPGCPSVAPSETFREALQAARNSEWERLELLDTCLGREHPLRGYLDFHRLRDKLPRATADDVQTYQQRYSALPLADSMGQMALRRFGTAKRFPEIREFFDTPPQEIALQCFWWRAQLKPRREAALAAAAELWLSGTSRPDACDPLFAAARSAGKIDEKAVWERLRLAHRHDQPGMVRYLRSLLESEHYRTAARWLARLLAQPERVRQIDDDLPAPLRGQLTADALEQLAHTDTATALQEFLALGGLEPNPPAMERGDRERVAKRIAWYSTIRGTAANRPWLDSYLADYGDGDLLAQRARRAVIEQNWPELLAWLDRLPDEQRQSPRWDYWKARALDEQGAHTEASEVFHRAAQHRSFWGFLAAERIGADYAFNRKPLRPSAPESSSALLRIQLLLLADESRLARNEWQHLITRSSEPERQRLIAHAHHQGWYALSVAGSLEADVGDALEWRFPRAYHTAFAAAAQQHDPFLLMALARRESGFNPEAVSAAGARGLMQLMPATANEVAGRRGQPPPSTRALFDPKTSTALGAAYLEQLLKRFGDNRLLALAAYNAGARRVEEWLPEEAVPFDVWIESIPYYETRQYVQAVLAYRLILVHLYDDRQESDRQLLLSHERNGRFTKDSGSIVRIAPPGTP